MPPIVGPLSGLSFGSCGVVIICGPGDPNVAATDDGNHSIQNAGVGSHFHRTDVVDSTHQFYVKTAIAIGAPGTWTNK
jgi:hypothetical protein